MQFTSKEAEQRFETKLSELRDGLVQRWKRDADQYKRQVDEAREKGVPHDQMLSMMTCLRTCACDLETSVSLVTAQVASDRQLLEMLDNPPSIAEGITKLKKEIDILQQANAALEQQRQKEFNRALDLEQRLHSIVKGRAERDSQDPHIVAMTAKVNLRLARYNPEAWREATNQLVKGLQRIVEENNK